MRRELISTIVVVLSTMGSSVRAAELDEKSIDRFGKLIKDFDQGKITIESKVKLRVGPLKRLVFERNPYGGYSSSSLNEVHPHVLVQIPWPQNHPLIESRDSLRGVEKELTTTVDECVSNNDKSNKCVNSARSMWDARRTLQSMQERISRQIACYLAVKSESPEVDITPSQDISPRSFRIRRQSALSSPQLDSEAAREEGFNELHIELPARELPNGVREKRESWIQCNESVSLEMVANAFAKIGIKIHWHKKHEDVPTVEKIRYEAPARKAEDGRA